MKDKDISHSVCVYVCVCCVCVCVCLRVRVCVGGVYPDFIYFSKWERMGSEFPSHLRRDLVKLNRARN